MKISVPDASNYLKGLLLLIRKDRKISEEEHELMARVGKNLGFEKNFVENAIHEILDNKYITVIPPEFSSREIAEKLNLMIAYNASTGESVGTTWADPDGNVSMLIPTGNVIAAFAYGTAETDLVWLFYSPDGVWQASNENTMYISVSEGSVSALSPIG